VPQPYPGSSPLPALPCSEQEGGPSAFLLLLIYGFVSFPQI